MAIEMTLILRPLSPLALHQKRAGVQYVETLDYIPGTALRGALAEAYLVEHDRPDDTFQALFLSGQVQYGDLWPTIRDKSTVIIPATAQACKRFGLKHKSSFRDSLLDAFSGPRDERCLCPVECDGKQEQCGEPLDRVQARYLCDVADITPVAAQTRLRVSTAIERSTGTVAREMLFTQHTLTGKLKGDQNCKGGKDLVFQGVLRLTEPALQAKLERLVGKGTLFLGSGRSRGLGEVKVEEWQEAAPDDSLQERWKKFNDAARRAGGDSGACYFSLTLLSHLALRDELLRPVLDGIGPRHFGLPNSVEWACYNESDQQVRFLSAITVAGWNAAQGLPKPDTVALERGSVLLFRCDAAQKQDVLARLAEIETESVGERRSEGFGRVAACYPIHYECWEVKQ